MGQTRFPLRGLKKKRKKKEEERQPSWASLYRRYFESGGHYKNKSVVSTIHCG
jgi:hypothetical protein